MQEPINTPAPPLQRHLKFWFEWRVDSCLWADCDHSREVFGIGPISLTDGQNRFETLPLSADLRARIVETSLEHNTALNWDDPAGPLLWTQDQCDAFNGKLDTLLADIRADLGALYTITDTRMRQGAPLAKDI